MANDVSFSLKNQMPMITQILPEKFEQAILKSSMTVNNNVKRILTGSRSGRLYRVPATKVKYRASAPMEAPAIRLGDLRQRYNYQVKRHGFNAIGYVGNPLPYAPMLEYGTKNIAPRPHLKKAFLESKADILRNFQGLL